MCPLPFKLTFVLHVQSLYLSFTLSKTLLEVSFIHHPVPPLICSLSIRFPLFKVTLEEVAIWKILLTLPVL